MKETNNINLTYNKPFKYYNDNKDDAVLQMIADTFVEQIGGSEKRIITRIFNEYSRATQELDKPPTAESLYKALKFAKAIRNLEDLIQSVCAIADGGFSFRIQGINGIYHIDIDIYNDKSEYVLLNKRNDSVTNAYNLNFIELLDNLEKLEGCWIKIQP